jgi:hypothetical protein
MDDFSANLSFKGALELYIYLLEREEELPRGACSLFVSLRSYLYDRLTVEEMESPKELLTRL